MEGDYGGRLWRVTMEGQLLRGDYGGVTMEGKLWRRLTMEEQLSRGLTMEEQLSRGLTMEGDYEGA